jgi:L-iditol 2-dehydrogenase
VRAAVLRGPGRLSAEEWPRPGIGAGELLLRVRGCGLCGSDIAKIVGPASTAPIVLGHELVGDVIEVGRGVQRFAVGDRVVAAHHVPCGDCHYCRRGSPSMCRTFKTSQLDPGGFAEYVRVPAPNVAHATFAIPPHLSDEAASFVEPLACCLRALRRANVGPGDTAVVIGLGSIGHLFVALLQRAGASVVPVDSADARRAFAERRGVSALHPDQAPALVDKRSEGRGADLVLVTAGGARVLEWAVRVVRDGGSIHSFAGGHGDALPVSLETFYHRELTLTSTYSSSPADLAEAFRLVAGGALDLEGLYTHRLALDRLGEGVELMRTQGAVKVYVTP